MPCSCVLSLDARTHSSVHITGSLIRSVNYCGAFDTHALRFTGACRHASVLCVPISAALSIYLRTLGVCACLHAEPGERTVGIFRDCKCTECLKPFSHCGMTNHKVKKVSTLYNIYQLWHYNCCQRLKSYGFSGNDPYPVKKLAKMITSEESLFYRPAFLSK